MAHGAHHGSRDLTVKDRPHRLASARGTKLSLGTYASGPREPSGEHRPRASIGRGADDRAGPPAIRSRRRMFLALPDASPAARDEAERERDQPTAADETRAARRQQRADRAQAMKQKVDELAALEARLGRPKGSPALL